MSPRTLTLVGVLVSIWLLAARAASAQPPPMLFEEGGGLTLTHLPAVLDHQEIRRQLDTGLTTTFLIKVHVRDAGGKQARGGARVQIRYELWDEIYQLAAQGFDNKLIRADLKSFEALQERWHTLALLVLQTQHGNRPSPEARIKVELDVIPFSRSEQQDTQRWFSESIERSGQGNAENAGRVSEERSETLGEVFNLLMATSIQRQAIMDFQWQVPLSRHPGPRQTGAVQKDRP